MKDLKRYEITTMLINARHNHTFTETEVILAKDEKEAVKKIQSKRGKKIVVYIRELEILPLEISEKTARRILAVIFCDKNLLLAKDIAPYTNSERSCSK